MVSSKANNAYKSFHGKAPKKVTTGNFYNPNSLICLGDAVEIVYRTNKINGGGDGKMAEYIHKFSKGTKLYMDERRGKILYISGNRLKVTRAGIVN